MSSSEEVHSLLKALVLFHFDKQAQKLQLAFSEALQMMEGAVPEVWPEGGPTSQTPVRTALTKSQPAPFRNSKCDVCSPQITGPNSTANSITASLQQQKPSASLPGECPAPFEVTGLIPE